MGRLDSHMDSQIELSKIFLTALLGFITIQNYIKNLLKRKERRRKTFIPEGASTNETKEPMRGAAWESFSRKNKSLKGPKYTNMSSIKREPVRDQSLFIAGGGMNVTPPPPLHHVFIIQANLSSPPSESFQSFQ